MTAPTREQEQRIADVSLRWGGAAVSRIGTEGDLVVVGMTDDVERCHLLVPPHGVARQATRDELRKAEGTR